MPAKKEGWGQWNGDLPEGPALDDLDELAKELGMTRAEANRVVLVAWSRALRGHPLVPVMGGKLPPITMIPGVGGQEANRGVNQQEQQEEDKQPNSPLEAVRARAAVTVSGIDLDDDD